MSYHHPDGWPVIDSNILCDGVPAEFKVNHDHQAIATWDPAVIVPILRGRSTTYDDTAQGRCKLAIDIGMVATRYNADTVAEFLCWLLPNTATPAMLDMWQETIYRGDPCPSCKAVWDGHILDHHHGCDYIDGLNRIEWDDGQSAPTDDETVEDIDAILGRAKDKAITDWLMKADDRVGPEPDADDPNPSGHWE